MATDPKNDNEIRDENLEDAAGGRVDLGAPGAGDDQQAEGGTDRIRTKL